MSSWIASHPQWFVAEVESVAHRYPTFKVDERLLQKGTLLIFGELVVRPPGGTKRHAVCLSFPDATPYVFPAVLPLERMPAFDSDGGAVLPLVPAFFDRFHQMPNGALCLFQHETRGTEIGESVRAVDVLKRAEKWFIGHHTGNWPPDSLRNELENHFVRSGDILIGERLFEPDISGHGEFYAIHDVGRMLVNRSHSDPPVIVTAILNKGSGKLAAVQDARKDLIPIFPWLENDSWDPGNLAELDERKRTEAFWDVTIIRGFWWSLKTEPEPFRDGQGLLKALEQAAPTGDVWAMVSDAMRGDIATKSRHLFGLQFPDRAGGTAWLFVMLSMEDMQDVAGGIILSTSDAEKRKRFAAGSITCFHTHAARRSDIRLRNETVVPSDIGTKSVALIGLGALGSKVAELLAQAGVGHFRLCDPERLTIGNVARHVGGLHEFGSPKCDVVKVRILEINPFAEIERVRHGSAISSLDTLTQFLDGVDVAISTIADDGAEAAINQVALAAGTPALYGRAMRRGSVGRVFLVRPGKDACKICLSQYAGADEHEHSVGWIKVDERPEDVLLHECGRPVIPASAVDLSFVAALTARKALDVLEGKEGENHWVWSRDGEPDLDPRLAQPFSVAANRYPPIDGCPICQVPPVNFVEIGESVSTEIRSQVEASPDAETGGVLLGYLDGRKAVVTRATGPGPKAVRTATRLERDVEYVQQEVERGLAELGYHGLYLGEWHSHLEADPEPSGQDIRSMVGIAAAPNYATDCPVMLIAGLDRATGKVSKVNAWAFPQQGQAHRIATGTPTTIEPPPVS